MRSRTTLALRAAFQAAVLAACHENETTTTPPDPVPVPLPTATTADTATAIATTPTATASAAVPIRVLANTQLGYGQRCSGAVVAGVTPSKPVEFLELRLEYFAPTHEIVKTGTTGAACATATNRVRCLEAIETARVSGAGEWLVYSRGDQVYAIAGRDIAPFLAPIDTPEDAAMTLVHTLAATSSGTVTVPCTPNAFHPVAGGWETVDVQRMMCGESTTTTYLVTRDGAVSVTNTNHVPPTPNCHMPMRGRRFEGMEDPCGEGDALGAFFATGAELEAASVHAFRRLGAELAFHGAPRSLRVRATRARKDEVAHARAMRKFAKRFRGASTCVRAKKFDERSLEAIAIENVVEGCVGETHAALVATWQAEHARDEKVRAAMKKIARDETRHAALAWDVAAWIAPLLTPEARERVEIARREALDRMSADEYSAPSLVETAGLPTRAQSRALVATLTALHRGVT